MKASELPSVSWAECRSTVGRCWLALVAFELVYSAIAATLLAPLALALFQIVVKLSGEAAVGNEELQAFLLSPLGVATLTLGGATWLALLFIEIAGLVLIFSTSLRRGAHSWAELTWDVLRLAPRLLLVAVVQTALVLAVLVPILAIAGCTYRALLSDADINYLLDARPPRFWVAAGIGSALAALAACLIGLLVLRLAFAVPACAIHDDDSRTALESSWRLTRGHGLRLLAILGGWQLVKVAVLAGLGVVLDVFNETALPRLEGGLATLVVSTGLLLAVNAAAFTLVSASFSIGLAVILAREYLRRAPAVTAIVDTPFAVSDRRRIRRASLATGLIVLSLLVWSAADSALLADRFVETRPVAVTAHRAGPSPAPENSLAALRLAIKAGADFAEIDVQLTRDGAVVLLHDRDLRRSSGIPRNLAELTLAELSGIDLRYGRPSPTGHEPIPTLQEVLAAARGKIRLNVELKDYEKGGKLAARVVEQLRGSEMLADSIVSCLDLPPLRETKRLAPQTPVGIILSASVGDPTRLPVEFLSLQQRKIGSDLVRRAHRRGMEVHVWSIKTREDALRAIELGADNLITDDPAAIREVVDWYVELSDLEIVLLGLRRWIRE